MNISFCRDQIPTQGTKVVLSPQWARLVRAIMREKCTEGGGSGRQPRKVDSGRWSGGRLYFFLAPTYSSTVLVEMVVVVLVESEDWMQVAVVVTVRQALQDVTPMVRAIRRNAMMIKFFFMIQTLLLLTIYGRADL